LGFLPYLLFEKFGIQTGAQKRKADKQKTRKKGINTFEALK